MDGECIEIFENFHVCRCKFCSRVACAALTLSCTSAKINQNWNVIAERRACEFARVREPSSRRTFRRHGSVVHRASHRVSILRCVAPFFGQIFRNNVTYDPQPWTHVARWIKEGSWLEAIRAFNLAHEPFGSRLPPRTCPALYP